MRNILCIVQTPVPSTEISITRPFNYLQNRGRIKWLLVLESNFRGEMLKGIDLVVFQRNCRPNGLQILKTVKAAKIPVIYELDDNYLEMPEDLPIGRYMRLPQVSNSIKSFFRLADLVKVGSPEMIPLIKKWNPKVICQPYAVDMRILENLSKKPHKDIVIGYAGSKYHSVDLKLIASLIPRINRKSPTVRWEFIGCLPEGIQSDENINFLEFNYDYHRFLVDLYCRNWDIGLAPLIDTPHNRCKTDNKFREYGACEIAGIFSDIPPYTHSVRHGVTGILVKNTIEEWYKGVSTLLADPKLRKEIASGARTQVTMNNSLSSIASLWEELFLMAEKEK